ncbi:MAG: DoxX family membrane protein, partial [Pontiella sp.]
MESLRTTAFSARHLISDCVLVRLTLGLVMFPHGAQKLLGWFGGYGFTGTMSFFTEQMGIPY